jgi:putative membrane-bound dehydrogenase-like protein
LTRCGGLISFGMSSSRVVTVLFAMSLASRAEDGTLPRQVSAAEGYTVSLAAPASLVERPVEACFDDKGRLYVTEVTGTNEPPEEQLKKAPHRVLRIEDTDGDGVFDKRTVFADKLGFPEGVLWHQGVVYVSVVPQILKFTDTNDDGVADKREVWFDGKTITGCANDLHGPYTGPDGLLYWCKGAFAEQTHDLPGRKEWKSRASHVFRMKPDGTEFDCVFTAGMDNPVGIEWLPEGDLIVSGTFFQHPGDGRRDGLIHAVRGGVWGKDHNVLEGHTRTGPLMPVMTHMGPAAPCGMCRYGRDLLVCQFNMRKVSRHVLEPFGSTWQTKDSDFLTCDHPDFHPTDVLQAPDGSVLVIDTGGWYKLCCPTSQVAKPEVTGAIYRLRKAGGEVSTARPEPRWKLEKPDDFESLSVQVKSPNLHVRRMAIEAIGRQAPAPALQENGAGSRKFLTPLLSAATEPGTDRFLEHAIIYAALPFRDHSMMQALLGAGPESPMLARIGLYWFSQTDPGKADTGMVIPLLTAADAGVREAAVFGINKVPAWRDAAGVWLKAQLAGTGDAGLLRAAVQAVAAEGAFRADLGAWMASAKPGPMQQMLLEVMVEAAAEHGFAKEWTGPLTDVLEANDAAMAPLAANVLAVKPPKMAEAVRVKLSGMMHDTGRPPSVRVPLMLALSPVTPNGDEFALLMEALRKPEATQAATVLSKATLTVPQLSTLATALPEAGLLQRPVLLRAFARATDEALGLTVMEQLEKANALAGLSAQVQSECFGKFPDKVQQRLTAARARLNQSAAQQAARLDELEKTLPAGESLRGKVVFQSAKASCVLCHQAGYFGKHIGPDLSKIGSIRTRRDLLEAIAFPSVSFVRSYEPVEVKKKDGTLAYGIIKNQSAQSITLVTGAVTPEVTVPATDIATLHAGAASLMPQGVDLILTPGELADLVAFLMSLK